jgi:hypothetical protein
MQFGPFRENANFEGIPPPSVYWNHWFREKLRNNILESIAYGQNLALKEVNTMLAPVRSSASALG